jgi:hypothetical protein
MERGIAEIRVTAPRKLSRDGVHRVSASVDGEELWFESAECELYPAPELFATALLPIAAAGGGRLAIEAGLDPVWTRNAARVLRVWREWWDTPGELDAVLAPAGGDPAAVPTRAPAVGVGLCFTLGVDSFYSLLRSGHRVDRLVIAEGYDVPLGDRPRMDAIRASLAEVSDSTGSSVAVVRTNLREHHVGTTMNWTRGHGGAIAALGHACSAEVGELLVSATKPYVADLPWGSHWRTDPGWSSSGLRVTHLGAEVRRTDKIAALADEPLVQRHLRVCWENRAPTGNCCECEKCVRTMLILKANRRLDRFSAFGDRGSLAERVDALWPVIPDVVPMYRIALEGIDDRRLRAAVEGLIARSEGEQPEAPGLASRLRRAALRLRAGRA